MALDGPQKNKQIKEAPEKKGAEKRVFMFPANSQHPVPVRVEASTQEEANALYTKIVEGAKITP